MAARSLQNRGNWVGSALIALALFASGPAVSLAADVESRDFQVLVDGKPAGDAHMTFNRQDDGVITVSCDTDVRVQILVVSYKYSYRGREVWKDNRLQRFDSTCNDDGKRFTVAAAPDKDNLRVNVNGRERLVTGDVWLTSYWRQPDAKQINQNVTLIDADNGKDFNGKITFVGVEQRNVAGQLQNVNHFRLATNNTIDLWYDVGGRLVRQEWVEQGHRTTLDLARLRK